MTATQIILEINKLPFSERISIIENTLKSLKNQERKKLEMKKAAKLLLDDYLNDYGNFYEAK